METIGGKFAIYGNRELLDRIQFNLKCGTVEKILERTTFWRKWTKTIKRTCTHKFNFKQKQTNTSKAKTNTKI